LEVKHNKLKLENLDEGDLTDNPCARAVVPVLLCQELYGRQLKVEIIYKPQKCRFLVVPRKPAP
jgi:hypothetical protein